MKTKALLVLLLTLSTFWIHAQEKKKEIKTISISVSGNCGECKERIEKASEIKGVKKAVWNKENKQLTISYRTDKADIEKITAAILKSGHDVENQNATDADYANLPDCCRYRDGSCGKKK